MYQLARLVGTKLAGSQVVARRPSRTPRSRNWRPDAAIAGQRLKGGAAPHVDHVQGRLPSGAINEQRSTSPGLRHIGAKISVAFADTPVYSWVAHAGVV